MKYYLDTDFGDIYRVEGDLIEVTGNPDSRIDDREIVWDDVSTIWYNHEISEQEGMFLEIIDASAIAKIKGEGV